MQWSGIRFQVTGVTVLSKFDDAIAFQAKALGLRAYRQQVLAENIANADTPNYKARDFESSRLRSTRPWPDGVQAG